MPSPVLPVWLIVVLVAVGGGAGANARFWLGRLVAHVQRGDEFPWATLIINVTGSAVLGVVAALFHGRPEPSPRAWALFLGTGVCGGYTTFSTFSLETLQLLRDDRPAAAAGYVLASVAGGLAGAWLALKAFEK